MIGTYSAKVALGQLENMKLTNEHMKLTNDVEFVREFDKDLIGKEHDDIRRFIFIEIPYPVDEQQQHKDWLRDFLASHESEKFKQLELELKHFDRMGLFLRMAKLNPELALDIWYDVLARFTVILQYFIAQKVEARGDGYLLNLRWLLKQNYEFFAEKRRGKSIKIERPTRIIVVKSEDIENALKTIPEALFDKA